MSNRAYMGVGSNLGSSLKNCKRSITLLEAHPQINVITQSSFYETEPVGPTDQDWFVNAVVEISTELDPLPLLEAVLEIEIKMGRIREEKWGPRIIDLDILIFDSRVISTDRLKIPHPEMILRRFVLAPLNELTPDFVHPQEKKTIRQLLSQLPEDKKVTRL